MSISGNGSSSPSLLSPQMVKSTSSTSPPFPNSDSGNEMIHAPGKHSQGGTPESSKSKEDLTNNYIIWHMKTAHSFVPKYICASNAPI